METQQKDPISALNLIEQQLDIFASCVTSIQEMTVLQEREILEVKQKYYDTIAGYQLAKETAFNKLESFATLNQDLVFGVKRSFKTKLGTIGFRMGKPKFLFYPPCNWDSVLAFLKEHLPSYVRTTYEPAKDKLIADRNVSSLAMYFPAMGLKIGQEESFYVDINK